MNAPPGWSLAALVSDARVDTQKNVLLEVNVAERHPSEGTSLDVVEELRERFDQSRSLIVYLSMLSTTR